MAAVRRSLSHRCLYFSKFHNPSNLGKLFRAVVRTFCDLELAGNTIPIWIASSASVFYDLLQLAYKSDRTTLGAVASLFNYITKSFNSELSWIVAALLTLFYGPYFASSLAISNTFGMIIKLIHKRNPVRKT